MADSFSIADGLIIGATLLGPILAVQAQKLIERTRLKSDRREWVFATLLTTRGSRLAQEHVRALNTIPVAFYVRSWSTDKRLCRNVTSAWRTYHDALSTAPDGDDEAQWKVWFENNDRAFIDLLAAIAAERGFDFDRIDLKKGAYHPDGTVKAQQIGDALMINALSVLKGDQRLRIEITEPPANGLGDQLNPHSRR